MIGGRREFMERLWLIVLPVLLLPIGAYAKPKMTVQLVAEGFDASGLIQAIYVVLPDGSHATANCATTQPTCGIDSFAPEKRVKTSCFSARESVDAFCYTKEFYSATRKVNDITIYAANGTRVYHITASWDSFKEGALPKPWLKSKQ
jgi:hypothetical protein